MEKCCKCKKVKIVHSRDDTRPICLNCFRQRQKSNCPRCNKKKVLANKIFNEHVCCDCYSKSKMDICAACHETKCVHSRDNQGMPLCKRCDTRCKAGLTYDEIREAIADRKRRSTKEYKRLYKSQYQKARLENSFEEKIKHRLRSRMSEAIKNGYKSASTMSLIGCSMNDFKQYLEQKFEKGMSWENYGRGGWHMDHIIPCCKFDLTIPEEQKICFHYTNIQPLWELDNLRKGRS